MTAKWLWGSVNIYVSDEDIGREVKRAELLILDSVSSTFHFFGAASEHRTIKGLVIGETDKNQIITDAIGDTSRTLTTPWASVATMKINGTPKFAAKMYGSATLDGTVYDTSVTPIYDAELELIQA